MTKEPKLEAAVRIVPEWQDYDQEIKQLQIRFQTEKERGDLYIEEAEEPRYEGKCKPWLLFIPDLFTCLICFLCKRQNNENCSLIHFSS